MPQVASLHGLPLLTKPDLFDRDRLRQIGVHLKHVGVVNRRIKVALDYPEGWKVVPNLRHPDSFLVRDQDEIIRVLVFYANARHPYVEVLCRYVLSPYPVGKSSKVGVFDNRDKVWPFKPRLLGARPYGMIICRLWLLFKHPWARDPSQYWDDGAKADIALIEKEKART